MNESNYRTAVNKMQHRNRSNVRKLSSLTDGDICFTRFYTLYQSGQGWLSLGGN